MAITNESIGKQHYGHAIVCKTQGAMPVCYSTPLFCVSDWNRFTVWGPRSLKLLNACILSIRYVACTVLEYACYTSCVAVWPWRHGGRFRSFTCFLVSAFVWWPWPPSKLRKLGEDRVKQKKIRSAETYNGGGRGPTDNRRKRRLFQMF